MTNAEAALLWLAREKPDLNAAQRAVTRVVKDGIRAREVIGRIRDLIKRAPPRMGRLEINEVMREVIEFTRSEAVKNRVSVRTELADGLPLGPGDRVQLQQVMLNLVINAIEAMSEGDDGARELLISTAKPEEGGVLVAVRDSGSGLAPAALECIFDAFYTTKPSGLGLGLSICRSIIETHEGACGQLQMCLGGRYFSSRCLPAQKTDFQYSGGCLARVNTLWPLPCFDSRKSSKRFA
jgi:C4-dicarboxylate-specific signal transduction histidine kinase